MDFLAPLAHKGFARLFAAQVTALLGTGLLTIALALLAYDLAGAQGGLVLGFALTLKMVAYVTLAPVANAVLGGLPRRELLVALDVIRAGVALILPFVTEIWQIYALVFVLQAASAAFTPTFQATIPDILPDERTYTRALSLSRLAQDVENIASPALAAVLLMLVASNTLFFGTALGFLGSAALVWWANPPRPAKRAEASTQRRIFTGIETYLATPRLRGLLALTLAAAAGGAMMIVNTAVIVGDLFGRGKADVALAMAVFGAGSALAAIVLPRVLDQLPDRPVMLAGAGGLSAALIFGAIVLALAPAFGPDTWGLYMIWMAASGFLYSAILTPTGRLLRRSAEAPERPALFAAHFALSHGCWLITYPLAGWLGAWAGMTTASVMLGLLAAGAVLAAKSLWPRISATADISEDV
ncbi:MFS transporter [Defluviimonas sp. WL0050]|uniref:MFS transporter n=1 Tax=Albidovulum litorale TaxID=2984134 RepID=A0ABT2ZIS9_9RHOB|nr:MFS transporter [Defluviimonas sp. WL0050]MCV2870955.1 MFS transporter [Defluviimonas sp. WL0050]